MYWLKWRTYVSSDMVHMCSLLKFQNTLRYTSQHEPELSHMLLISEEYVKENQYTFLLNSTLWS